MGGNVELHLPEDSLDQNECEIVKISKKGYQFNVDIKQGISFLDLVYALKLLEIQVNEGIMMQKMKAMEEMNKNKLISNALNLNNKKMFNPNFIDRLRGKS